MSEWQTCNRFKLTARPHKYAMLFSPLHFGLAWAPLQHLMPEFEEMAVDVVAVSADTRGKACSFVSGVRLQAQTEPSVA